MTILGIDHVEFYVGDLEKSAAALCRGFGFRAGAQACAAPAELGGPGAISAAGGRSMLLGQGRIKLLLTSGGAPGHPAADFVERHGDGVASIAFRTDDVRQAFNVAVAGGARPIAAPLFARREDGLAADGIVGQAMVSGFGDVTHRLVERAGDGEGGGGNGGGGGGRAAHRDGDLLEALDHAAICLRPGQMEEVVRFYWKAFGFSHTFDERIEVGGQAMISKVIQDRAGAITFTLLEPDPEREPGQIDQFLTAHGGAGVQHIALRTPDIVRAVRALSDRGVEFLAAPAGYYRSLEGRLGAFPIPVDELREANVLADRDPWGQLFQIFSHSTHERRTFFFELIERRGARTFGTGNIRALYEALYEEQTPRLHGRDG
jgi:4-hydroxymandelate synthase